MASSTRPANAFALAPDGSVDFGRLRALSDFPDRVWPSAPVRLECGSLRYGLAHIEAKHGAKIVARGYPTVEAFVETILRACEDILHDTRSDNVLVVHRRGGINLKTAVGSRLVG